MVLTAALAACALTPAGPPAAASTAVVAWGRNTDRQLDAGYKDRAEQAPVSALGLGDVRALTGTWEAAFALLPDGTVRAWGSDIYGQLGDGVPSGNKGVPTPVEDSGLHELRGVTQVSAAGDHAMALLADGQVATWGESKDGTRGNGESGSQPEAEAAGDFHNRNLALTLDAPTHVVQVAAGAADYALEQDGTVWSWGSNVGGRLGTGTEPEGPGGRPEPEACVQEHKHLPCSTRPVRVDLGRLPPGVTVTGIAAGVQDGYAILSNGEVMAWGSSGRGQLGDGSYQSSAAPVPVDLRNDPACPGYSAAAHCPVVQLSAGGQDVWALLENGTVIGWGDNRTGELGSRSTEAGHGECRAGGDCSTIPKLVLDAGNGPVRQIAVSNLPDGAAGWGLALIGGTVYTLGGNVYGNLGTGGTPAQTRVPVPVEGLPPVSAIAASPESSFAVLEKGTGPAPLLAVTRERGALAASWTVPAEEMELNLAVVTEGGIPVRPGRGRTVVVHNGSACTAQAPCRYTFTEGPGGAPLSAEDEYRIRAKDPPEAAKLIWAAPLP